MRLVRVPVVAFGNLPQAPDRSIVIAPHHFQWLGDRLVLIEIELLRLRQRLRRHGPGYDQRAERADAINTLHNPIFPLQQGDYSQAGGYLASRCYTFWLTSA